MAFGGIQPRRENSNAGAGYRFYSTPGAGTNEVRIAYVLKIDDLRNAMVCLEKACRFTRDEPNNMKRRFLYFLPLLTLFLFSCESESTVGKNMRDQPKDEGIVGVFDVPEMACLSIMDSASATEMSAKYSKNYALLEEDFATLRMRKKLSWE